MDNQIECLLKRVERIGIVESDSPDERIRKTVLAAFAIIVGGAVVVWGVNYLAYDEKLVGSILLVYATCSFLALPYSQAQNNSVGCDPLSLF